MDRKFFIFQNLRLSYLEVNPTAPQKILIAHANGYAAGMYDYLIAALGKSHHVCALDFAGHGASETTLEFSSWNFFRDQLLALLDHLGWRTCSAIGHSLGGGGLLRAAELHSERFEKIVAFDPVMLNLVSTTYVKFWKNPMARTALHRRAEFKNKEQALKIFSRHPANRAWQRESVEAFVKYCIRETPNGAELCCAPALEAKIFSLAEFAHLFALRKITCATHLVLPVRSHVCPPRVAGKIVANNSQSAIERLPGTGHLLPFENHALTLEVTMRELAVQIPAPLQSA